MFFLLTEKKLCITYILKILNTHPLLKMKHNFFNFDFDTLYFK